MIDKQAAQAAKNRLTAHTGVTISDEVMEEVILVYEMNKNINKKEKRCGNQHSNTGH